MQLRNTIIASLVIAYQTSYAQEICEIYNENVKIKHAALVLKQEGKQYPFNTISAIQLQNTSPNEVKLLLKGNYDQVCVNNNKLVLYDYKFDLQFRNSKITSKEDKIIVNGEPLLLRNINTLNKKGSLVKEPVIIIENRTILEK